MQRTIRLTLSAFVAAAACTAATAGGNLGATSGGGSTADGVLPSAAGDQAATVMVITDVTEGQIAYSAPEAVPAVQAAFAQFPNVEVTVCDAKGDQNEYLNCQRQAVDDGVTAVIVGWSSGGLGGEDVLTEAGIPALGSTGTTAENSYAFSSNNGSYVGLGAGSATAGCTEYGILHLEGTDMLADMVAAGAASAGGEEVSRAAVPANAPDLAPSIAKLLGDGATCIILSVSPPMLVQAMTAINQSGETPLVAAVGAILPQQIIDALGPLSEGMLAIESTLSGFDDAPVLEELRAAMAEFDDEAPITTQSNLGFVAGHVLATAISQVDGEVSSSAVIEQLDTIADLDLGGIVQPVTVTDLDSPTLQRWMNPWSLVYVIEDGRPVRAIDDWVDLRSAVEGL